MLQVKTHALAKSILNGLKAAAHANFFWAYRKKKKAKKDKVVDSIPSLDHLPEFSQSGVLPSLVNAAADPPI